MNTIEVTSVNHNLELNPKNPPTVAQLRKNGYKVRVNHFRYSYQPDSKLIGNLLPQSALLGHERFQKGGETVVEITTPDGKDNYTASARCNLVDAFNRRKGVQICLGRICRQITDNISVPF